MPDELGRVVALIFSFEQLLAQLDLVDPVFQEFDSGRVQLTLAATHCLVSHPRQLLLIILLILTKLSD